MNRCALALSLLIALVAAGAGAAEAGPLTPGPRVDIHSAAGLAPDGHSITVSVLASCPERWEVIQAVVTVTQPQTAGQASFPLTCIGSWRSFSVSVPTSGTFELGEAQVDASVVIKRGRTDEAHDSEIVQVDPSVVVRMAETAQLESGGAALTIGVTVACPVGGTGLQSNLVVDQAGITMGSGSYDPICDGQEHTFAVRVEATKNVYRMGDATALTFANTQYGDRTVYGVDSRHIQVVA